MALDLIIDEEEKLLHIVTDESNFLAERLLVTQSEFGCELFALIQHETIFLGRLKPEMSAAAVGICVARWSLIDETSCIDTRVLTVEYERNT